MTRVLILGGTGEARSLAAALADDPGVDTVSSLAGRIRDPRIPAGEVRIGGFGGADGLAAWLQDNPVDVVVDATHPFAARITANAITAAECCGTPLVVLRRPEWMPRSDDDWRQVADLSEAAGVVRTLGERVFLTIGRQGVDRFADQHTPWFLIRAIDPPEVPMPPRSTLLLDRGPFTVAAETALMREHAIDIMVTKNSGGDQTAAKLDAARDLRIPVVVVRRPPLPAAIPTVDDVAKAVGWVRSLT